MLIHGLAARTNQMPPVGSRSEMCFRFVECVRTSIARSSGGPTKAAVSVMARGSYPKAVSAWLSDRLIPSSGSERVPSRSKRNRSSTCLRSSQRRTRAISGRRPINNLSISDLPEIVWAGWHLAAPCGGLRRQPPTPPGSPRKGLGPLRSGRYVVWMRGQDPINAKIQRVKRIVCGEPQTRTAPPGRRHPHPRT